MNQWFQLLQYQNLVQPSTKFLTVHIWNLYVWNDICLTRYMFEMMLCFRYYKNVIYIKNKIQIFVIFTRVIKENCSNLEDWLRKIFALWSWRDVWLPASQTQRITVNLLTRNRLRVPLKSLLFSAKNGKVWELTDTAKVLTSIMPPYLFLYLFKFTWYSWALFSWFFFNIPVYWSYLMFGHLYNIR